MNSFFKAHSDLQSPKSQTGTGRFPLGWSSFQRRREDVWSRCPGESLHLLHRGGTAGEQNSSRGSNTYPLNCCTTAAGTERHYLPTVAPLHPLYTAPAPAIYPLFTAPPYFDITRCHFLECAKALLNIKLPAWFDEID